MFYGARMYDPALGRWFNVDPLAEKSRPVNPYAYCLDCPVKYVDPDGKDFRLYFDWNKEGNLTGLRFESLTYITGTGASDFLAMDLTWAAKAMFSDFTVDGINVSFDIRYEYSRKYPSMFTLKPGDNVLEFTNKMSSETDRSHVWNGRFGEIHKNDWGNTNAILHETGHFLGLTDRYDMFDPMNMGKIFTLNHKDYENDLMGQGLYGNPRFDRSHYEHFVKKFGNPLLEGSLKQIPIFYHSMYQIDRNRNGEKLTPYEDGGIHKPKHPGYKLLNP